MAMKYGDAFPESNNVRNSHFTERNVIKRNIDHGCVDNSDS